MDTSPITFELDGQQYVVTGSGSVMFAWALPKMGSSAHDAPDVRFLQ